MPLNDLQCRSAPLKDKPYKLSDGEGLYLQVMPNGQRYWRLKYRIHGKEKRLALGVYPQTSLQEARERRFEAKNDIRNGKDPSLIHQQKKKLARYEAAQTFELIAREWHEREAGNWTEKHAEGLLRRIEYNILKHVGHYPIRSITPPMLLTCLQKIEKRGAFDIAHRMKQYCSKIFCYAVVTGRADRDITVDMKGGLRRYKKGHYAAIEVDELPQLVKAINANEARLYRQTTLAMKLMLLTFVRTSELIHAKWPEFDFDKAEWIISAERMKMGNVHIVPLSKQSITILKELQEYNGNREHVFPSIPRPRKPMSNCTILGGLKRMGYKGKMTGHGFRALAMSTIKEKLGYQHEVVDRQLAHAPKSGVDRAYDRAKFLPQRREMMQKWADYIDRVAKSPETENASPVLPSPYIGASVSYTQNFNTYQHTPAA
ncbi:tyrosine-type recombinase/integrase [Chitinophaga sp. SYP-B3965]|uniref:tyrosine-type recombinase/integrase n=1 Tax=Chitinophaga sp. SYP-B3965 TaxID=2663120 RepID=UPI001299CB90|nr:integrase arm-type DNA-binding domain-containing protein [Chitinophaga sp. SYP-B3965]MRG48286.1 tyrosine-type recombinase/integrase [Chitinophaga sp. SYP-B3965]